MSLPILPPPPRPQRIPRLPHPRSPPLDPLDFGALLNLGIRQAQAASGALWTDYNLHDPGVTLLESLCYALTEEVFAARRAVPTLMGLTPGEALDDAEAAAATPDWPGLRRHGLLPPLAALGHRPCSSPDYLRWLLALLPAARHLGIHAEPALGLWRIRLQDTPDSPTLAALAARSYWAQRNLGEDLLAWPQRQPPHWVSLQFKLSIASGLDLVEFLCTLLQHCDDYLAARPQAHNAAHDGIPDDDELRHMQDDRLYLSDLARFVAGMDGVLTVHNLGLTEPDSGDALPVDQVDWQQWPETPGGAASAGNAAPTSPRVLALRWPEHPDDLAGWQLLHRGSQVQLPVAALFRHLADVRRAAHHLVRPEPDPPAPARSGPACAPEFIGAPDSEAEDASYYPATAALPELYRQPQLLRWHSDARSRHAEPGLAAQWLGYRCLLELPLAQLQSQRQRLAELYQLDQPGDAPSYWWALPDEQALPGLDALIVGGSDARELGAALLAGSDQPLQRRNRALDHQLALFGESLHHDALEGLPRYLPPAQWQAHLISLKQQLARQLQRHTEHRYAGIDYSQPALDVQAQGQPDPANTAPLAQRLAWQLAFAHSHSRRLLAPLAALGIQFNQEAPGALRRQDSSSLLARLAPGQQALAVPAPTEMRSLGQLWPALLARIPGLRRPLDPALLRCAGHGDRYALTPATGALTLGPDESGRAWTLARGLSQAQAEALAAELQQASCAIQFECEGLHLVEHVLLRPSEGAPEALDSFYRQRISLVLPDWTARCASKRFRRLLRDAAERAAPAHLRCRPLWLSPRALQAFETAWGDWLQVKRFSCQWTQAEPGHAAELPASLRQRLDHCAAAVADCLRRAGA